MVLVVDFYVFELSLYPSNRYIYLAFTDATLWVHRHRDAFGGENK